MIIFAGFRRLPFRHWLIFFASISSLISFHHYFADFHAISFIAAFFSPVYCHFEISCLPAFRCH